MAAAGAGAGGGYLNALRKAFNSVLPVSAGTRAAVAAANKQMAAKESEYVTPAGSGSVQVVAAAAPQGGQGRRRKNRKTTKQHSRRSRRRSHRRHR